MLSAPGEAFKDFTRAYWTAGRDVMNGWEGLAPHFERGIGGFVNLPVLAYLFAPFALVDAQTAAWIITVIGIAAVIYAWWKIGKLYEFDLRTKVFSLFLIAAFGPLIYSFKEANTTHILLVPLVLGIAAMRDGKDYRAGALIAIAALLKPLLMLIGVIAFLRGRIKVALGGAAVIGATALLSLAVFGWDAHVHWYEESIQPFSSAPMPAYNTQSIASSLSRAERGPPDYWIFDVAPLSAPFQIALYLAYAALFAALLWALAPWKSLRADNRQFEGEVMLALMLAMLISTLAWTHYFALAVLPAAWLWREVRDHGLGVKLALALAYVMAAPIVFFGARMGAGDFGPAFYILGSHVCVAALILFALLAKSRHALARTPA
jgi:hypothetical protein